MRPLLGFFLLVALEAAFTSTAWSTQKAQLPSPEEEWIQVESEHFVLFGNAGKKTLVGVAREMERFGAALAILLPTANDVSPLPTHVYVFKDQRWFGRYAPSRDPEHPSAGLFVHGVHGNNIVIDAEALQDGTRVVFHEYTHFHLTCIGLRDIPLWLNEGLAEYFSTFRSKGDRVEIGRRVDNHVFWLREHDLIAMDQLFEINHQSPEYNEGERRGTFYAQSWALVHYLMSLSEGLERVTRLRGFLETLGAGSSVENALEDAFGSSQAALLKGWKDFIYTDLYRVMEITFKELTVNEAATVQPLPHVETLFWLGSFLAHRGDESGPAAEAHFQAALAQQPDHGPSLAGLAYLLHERKQLEEAARLFDQAVRADPTGALTHLLAAENLLEIVAKRHRTRTAKGLVPEEIQKAQSLLLRAIELEPDHTRARAQLGYSYLFGEQDPSPGIAALEYSAAALYTDAPSAYNLLLLYLRRQDRAAARNVYDRFLRLSRNPEMRDHAWEAIQRSEITLVDSLIHAKEFDVALAHIQRIASEAQDPEFMKSLEKKVETMWEFRAQQLELDRYIQAAKLVHAHKYVEAEKALVAFLAEAKAPDLRKSAAKMLKDVRRARAATASP